MDARTRHLRGALNSIEFPLELTRKTEVNQSMKYIHSSKFKAIGVAIATAVAVATATPGSATPAAYHMTDPTGHMTDTTGPKDVTDTSGHSLGGGNIKKEPHFSVNREHTAAVQRIVSLLAQAQKDAQSSNPSTAAAGQAEFNRLLPIARQLLANVIVKQGGGNSSLTHPKPEPHKMTDPTGHMTDTTGPKATTDTSGHSLDKGAKNELKGSHVDPVKLAQAQALLAKLNTLTKGSTEYDNTLMQLKLLAAYLGSSPTYTAHSGGW
jgi:hypothetical protein